jgi:OOP family OmpA-OmpF porin
MPSSRRAALSIALAIAASTTSPARAQQQSQGFAVERFYPAAPGSGWMVMDDLAMHGGLGGALAVAGGYAHDSLRVTDGYNHLSVVSDQALVDIGAGVTYDRFRLYANFDSPLQGQGQSGTVGAYQFTAPSVTLGSNPDSLSDVRVGFDARLYGDSSGPFRLGAGAQLYAPSGSRADYSSDGTYRAMGRVLFAGTLGMFGYAGQLGVHVRPLDDSPAPGSPQGSELLFGVAGGPRFAVDHAGKAVVVVGPEIYGESAFKSLFGSTSTGVEALLTGRIEGTGEDGPQIQAKLGVGGGLDPRFGAPEWRCVFAISVFDHSVDSDKDGVTDSKDACPGESGAKTSDPKTNGCPPGADAVAPTPPSP